MRNDNYLDKYLDIKVLPDKTVINYWKDEKINFTHEHNIGLKNIEENLVSHIILDNWLNQIIFTLENISLLDRVPTFIYLTTEKYSSSFLKILNSKNIYSQFYVDKDSDSQKARVIIKKINYSNINSLGNLSQSDLNNSKINNKSYERYTKAISQFKI